MPFTEELLSQIIETVQAFQIRRACKIINQLIEQNEPFKIWEIQRKAAIKLHHFQEIKTTLAAYIQYKEEVSEGERTLG
ncbi:hypothetical protein DN401_04035 [Bacillus sp. BF2-3]|uniref:hypothetical protein n=1 Tax=Bacillus sp. BF2-3 TaxID=2217827 RepID=UPI0011EEFE91|nr:hypothetical protein [Bacillus sp. BF2-3]KAA0757984.1 hypothetical protein DN401_04035 [Bacillus sp. BF2-3]